MSAECDSDAETPKCWKKVYRSGSFYNTNFTRIGLGSFLGLRGEMLISDRPCLGRNRAIVIRMWVVYVQGIFKDNGHPLMYEGHGNKDFSQVEMIIDKIKWLDA